MYFFDPFPPGDRRSTLYEQLLTPLTLYINPVLTRQTVHEQLLASRAAEFLTWRETAKSAKSGLSSRQPPQQRHKKHKGSGGCGGSPVLVRSSGRPSTSLYATSAIANTAASLDEGDGSGTTTAPTAASSSSSSSSSTTATASAVDSGDQEGLLSIGKLCEFSLPPGYRVSWRSVLTIGERKSVTEEKKTEGGSGTGSTRESGGKGEKEKKEEKHQEVEVAYVTAMIEPPSDPSLSDALPSSDDGDAMAITSSCSDASIAAATTTDATTSSPGSGPSPSPSPSTSVVLTHLPMSGFFGLDEPDIRLWLEGRSRGCRLT